MSKSDSAARAANFGTCSEAKLKLKLVKATRRVIALLDVGLDERFANPNALIAGETAVHPRQFLDAFFEAMRLRGEVEKQCGRDTITEVISLFLSNIVCKQPGWNELLSGKICSGAVLVSDLSSYPITVPYYIAHAKRACDELERELALAQEGAAAGIKSDGSELPAPAQGAGDASDPPVTLDQAAAIARMSKRTLERHVGKKLPDPDFRGGGGRPHKWLWSKLREPLGKIANRTMPVRYPGDRII